MLLSPGFGLVSDEGVDEERRAAGDAAVITCAPPPVVVGAEATHRLVVDLDQIPAGPLLKSLLRSTLLEKEPEDAAEATRGGGLL